MSTSIFPNIKSSSFCIWPKRYFQID